MIGLLIKRNIYSITFLHVTYSIYDAGKWRDLKRKFINEGIQLLFYEFTLGSLPLNFSSTKLLFDPN